MADDTFYGSDFGALQAFDPDIAGVLLSELGRIRGGLQLIASEHLAAAEVRIAVRRARELPPSRRIRPPEGLPAQVPPLPNKDAEGSPGRRYYGGCVEVDKA